MSERACASAQVKERERDGVSEGEEERVSARGTAAPVSEQTPWQMLTAWHWFLLHDCKLDE